MTPVAPSRGDSLGGSIGWFSASYTLNVIGFLGLNALAARALGTAEFGGFVLIYTVAVVLGQVGLVGVHRTGVREVARLTRYDDRLAGDLRGDLTTISRTALPATAIVTGIAVAIVARAEVTPELLGVATGVLVYLTGQQKLAAGYLRGLGHVRLSGLLEGRSGGGLITVTQALLVALLLWVVPRPGLTAVTATVAAAYVLPVIWGRVVINRRFTAARRRIKHPRRFLHICRRDWRFFLVSTATSISQFVELWLAGAILVAADSSYFSAGHRLASLLVIPLAALQVVCSPVISRLWHSRDLATLTTLVRTAATAALIANVGLLVILLVAPGATMARVFGPAFASAGPVLVILAIGMLGTAVSGLGGALLSMSDHEGRAAVITVTTLALRVLCGVWAGTSYGLTGLAASSAAITIGHNLWLVFAARRLTGISTLPTAHPRPRLFLRLRG